MSTVGDSNYIRRAKMNADDSNNRDIIIITVRYDLNPALACGLC